MSARTFVAALVVPLCVTTAAVVSATYNRTSGREPIVLTERELHVYTGGAENTTASLWLNWQANPVADPRRLRQDRSLPRRAFVALELDGPAFRALPIERERERASRLVVVDVDPDADTLARRYPNGRSHLITSGVVRVAAGQTYANAVVVSLEPQRIQVPRDWMERLPRVDRRLGRMTSGFEVELRYGRNLEPWITAVRLREGAPPGSPPQGMPGF